ncbi:MAG: non-canonical purine NTP diphosphatase [Flavobacterium sp.]|jgi:XTP/dITP diphosphohydrolase
MKLLFATNNINKAHEIQELIKDLFQILSLKDIDCIEDIPEDQATIIGNAQQKAQYIYNKYLINVFADDTGLEIEALDNAPGVYSARYAGPQRNAEDNMNKVLENLKNIDNRKAQFKTVICLIIDHKEYFFEGIIKGTIINEKRGELGFGYDPIFVPDGYDKTFAEMTISEKSMISHRGIAIQKMISFLETYKN